ncbi:MAG: hypothetical protein NTY77_19505 [Elusimicrobia bacterium]|nr:hypothetical protein [Elusimicrobiota bacterium]
MTRTHILLSLPAALLLVALAARPSRAGSALDKLSPAARAEIERLSPAERAELSGVQPGSAATAPSRTGSDGNDWLCTRWGCVGGTVLAAAGSWHSSPDGSYPENLGWSAGVDAAAPIPALEQYGLGAQFAWSYGQFDLNGRASASPDYTVQQQQFYSLGLFRRPDPSGSWWLRWGLGAAHDFSANRSAGTRADIFTLRQWRLKASYDITRAHGVGMWGVLHQGDADVPRSATVVDIYRSVDQLNFFYRYHLPEGGSLSAYLGPGIGGTITNGRTGVIQLGGHPFKYTFGADARVPITDHLALFGDLAFAKPNIAPGKSGNASVLSTYSLQAGLRFYWGGNARVRDDTGRHWMPYLPDANNGNFIAQSNFVD